jgi:hypothetical protein
VESCKVILPTVSDTLISLYIQRKERCGGDQEAKRRYSKENKRKNRSHVTELKKSL